MMRSLQHSSAVGAGFIPVLPTADKIQSKCPAAARVGFIPVLPTADKIQSKCPAAAGAGINPTPTLDVCCIAALCRA